jgi:uroporphyrin-III C-methyltransferase
MTFSDLSPRFERGTVWLVGAGPGDPGLLTLHALNALRAADIVVYDALVDPRTLALAGPEAALHAAGKRGGKPSAEQRDITERLIEFARGGLRVLRLKGGDPFVFGRGGEEALALAEARIPFRIVPGVSSGLASLAIHGIPATTRTTNHAVILATGHRAEGALADWAPLARAGAPIVLYMAVANLAGIVAGLIEGGLSENTPALAVHAVTTPAEEVVPAPLRELPRLAEQGVIRAPAVIAIGAIAEFRARLRDHLSGAQVR